MLVYHRFVKIACVNVKITLPTVRAVFYTLFLIIFHIVLNLLVVDWGPEIGAQHVEINEEELLAMRGARAEVEPLVLECAGRTVAVRVHYRKHQEAAEYKATSWESVEFPLVDALDSRGHTIRAKNNMLAKMLTLFTNAVLREMRLRGSPVKLTVPPPPLLRGRCPQMSWSSLV